MANTTYKNRLGELFPAGLPHVDGLFEHFFGPTAGQAFATSWKAPASVWEEEGRIHIEIDAPGVKKDGVEVTFDKGQLSLTIERSRPEGRRYWHNERGHGKITRTVALPDTVDAESLQAKLNDGVLRVSVAKRPEAQPKRVELQ